MSDDNVIPFRVIPGGEKLGKTIDGEEMISGGGFEIGAPHQPGVDGIYEISGASSKSITVGELAGLPGPDHYDDQGRAVYVFPNDKEGGALISAADFTQNARQMIEHARENQTDKPFDEIESLEDLAKTVKPEKGAWKKDVFERPAAQPQALKDSEGNIGMEKRESQAIGRQLLLETWTRIHLTDATAEARRNMYFAVHGARSFCAAPYEVMRNFVKAKTTPFKSLLPKSKEQAKKPSIHIHTED